MPVGILIDTCASVYGQEQVVNQWVQTLLRQMRQHSDTDRRIRVLAVHYNHSVHPVAEFLPLDQIGELDLNICDTCGTTDIGGALLYVLRRIREQTSRWSDGGAVVLCPVVIAVCGEYPTPAFDASGDELQLFWGRYHLAASQLRILSEKQRILFAAALVNKEIPFGASDRCCRFLRQMTQDGARLLRVGPADTSEILLGEMLRLAWETPCPSMEQAPWTEALEQILNL